MVITLMALFCHAAKWRELNKSDICAHKSGCAGGEKEEKSKSKAVKLLSK